MTSSLFSCEMDAAFGFKARTASASADLAAESRRATTGRGIFGEMKQLTGNETAFRDAIKKAIKVGEWMILIELARSRFLRCPFLLQFTSFAASERIGMSFLILANFRQIA